MTQATLRLASRGSALALAQARLAQVALERVGAASTEVVVVRTRGDRQQGVPAEQMEGQGWFTTEVETAIIDGRADAAVHSAKDLPTELGPGLHVRTHLDRADPRDGLVSRDRATLAALADGARVGTSSPRRAALLVALRPELRPTAIRGNVDSRLGKLDAGEFDALLLACAGLDRLGLGGRLAERLDPTSFVPAPAQGAIAIETAAGSAADAICAAADHRETTAAVVAERRVLIGLGGGCRLPLGAWARLEDGALVLSAALVVDGMVRRVEIGGPPADAVQLGDAAAERLRWG